jgi:hypothetical protein
LNGTTSNSSRNFSLTNIPEGSFNINEEFIGYQTLYFGNIILTGKHEVINLKNILLKKKQELLQSVTVTAQGKLTDNMIDRVVITYEVINYPQIVSCIDKYKYFVSHVILFPLH